MLDTWAIECVFSVKEIYKKKLNSNLTKLVSYAEIFLQTITSFQ